MSPRWNWDSPTPLAASECALPPKPKGGGAHSPAAKGLGESQFRRLEKRLALCLLCVPVSSFSCYAYFLSSPLFPQCLLLIHFSTKKLDVIFNFSFNSAISHIFSFYSVFHTFALLLLMLYFRTLSFLGVSLVPLNFLNTSS